MATAPERLYERAQAAHRAGRHVTARRLLERARSGEVGADLAGRIELSLAYVESETGDAERGLARCRAALDLPGTSTVTRGLIWSQLALLAMRAGDNPQAVADFGHAIRLLVGEPEHLGRALLNRGDLHLRAGDPAAAARDLEAAATHFRDAGLPVQAAKAEHNLGYAMLLTGDLVGALVRMDSASRVLSGVSRISRAVGEQDRAEVLLAAGRVQEATAALEDAVEAYRQQRLPRFQADCQFVLARTLLVEDPARARVVARAAARRFRATGSAAWATRAEALAVAAAIRAGCAGSPALLRRADQVADELRAAGQHRDREQLLLAAVQLLVRRGELDEAAGRLRGLRLPTDAPVTLRLLRHQVAAELQRARGHAGRARRHARAGLGELHRWQASFGSLDLQSTLVGHGNDLARIGLDQALSDGDPRLVLEWSERARALAARVTPVRPPRDPELAAALTDLRALPADQHGRRQELRDRIRQRSWYGAGGGEVEEPIDLVALQERLGATHAALVAHVVLDRQLRGLVVTGEDAQVVDLGESSAARRLLERAAADLDTAATHRTGALGEAVRATLRADLAGLGAQLVTPLLPLVGDRRVVLTPSALLAGTPWSALPGFRGRPLTVAVSATRWHRLTGTAEPPEPRVGLVAGPHVARAPEEVRRAAAAWPDAAVLTGAQASAPAVQELAGSVDVLHLAGHGRHSGDHPLFSAVQLHDGPWFGHDVDTLPRAPSLVVLSACELGQMTVRSAEETVGMTAAWLHAGARTVVSAPVLVADDLACEVLADWHQRVAAGAAPADALAASTSGPDDVAPFLCHGAGW